MRFKRPVLPEGIEERFWRFVDRSGECWIWTGSKRRGYGQIAIGKNLAPALAHRVSFALAGREFTGEGIVRHVCDNPPCVRPDHLLSGTMAENSEDMGARGRRKMPQPRLGEDNHWSRWTNDQVRAMRAAYAAGESQASIARRFGDGGRLPRIGPILRGEAWRHLL